MNIAPLIWLSSVFCAPLAAQQVCDADAGAPSSPTARFIDNRDGTVTDKESKLMWARCTVGQQWADGSCKGEASRHSWQAAQGLAAATNGNGSLFFSDWRLPLLRELATIAERQCSNPRINLTVFPNTPSAAYWSVTLRPGSTTSDAAFALSFGADGIEHQSMDQQHHVRLVRSAR